jgi:hypothetical protein
LSKRDSEPRANNQKSLAKEAQSRFFALDHVGVVRHFDGVDLKRLVDTIRTILVSESAKFEDSQEQMYGTSVYTNIATLDSLNGSLTLWITGTDVQAVGSVFEAKLFHPTEQSAEADERLSSFVEKLHKALDS